MDGRVHAERFTDDSVKDRESLQLFVSHGAEPALAETEVLNLFLIQSLTFTIRSENITY